jgi:hypothetical protein
MTAMCFKIMGQRGRWYDVPAGGAAFYADEIDDTGPFLMTGPDFGCVLFEAGKPRSWGDRGD